MIKGVVFDLDHTLYDRYATYDRIIPEVIRQLRGFFSPTLTNEQIAWAIKEYDRRYIHYEWEILIRHMAEDGICIKPADWRDYQNLIRQEMTRVAVPYPFAIPALEELRRDGLKLGLITNGASAIQRPKLRMLGLEDRFDAVIVSGELGVDKPDRAPFDAMADMLKLKSGELLYVGDNPLNDVEGARRAGYVPVWIRTMGFWTMPEICPPELAADTVAEIPALVRERNRGKSE